MQVKILGIGKVKVISRQFKIQEEDGARRIIDLSDDAIQVNYPRRSKKFYQPQIDDVLIFSAKVHHGSYTAIAVVRPEDLIAFTGTLTVIDPHDKYCHLTVQSPPHEKVFVPFSTRMGGGSASWHGNGASPSKTYKVRAFRQQESHGCKLIAWSIAEAPPQRDRAVDVAQQANQRADHQVINFVEHQLGVIFSISDEKVVMISSPTCQNTTLDPSLFEPWMKPGRFVSFKGRRISDSRDGILIGSDLEDLGSFYPYANENPLVLTVSGIANKVCYGKYMWAWNDHIGRIKVPFEVIENKKDVPSIFPFVGIQMSVVYGRQHDDSPWVAKKARFASEADSKKLLNQIGQLLKTDDGWKVDTISDGVDNPSIFLVKHDEHNRRLTAYARLMDVNGDYLPPVGTPVRVTYFRQLRHDKHALKVLLMTPIDNCIKYPRSHLIHNGTGRRQTPKLFEEPTPKKAPVVPAAPRVIIAPPPAKNAWNIEKLGVPKESPKNADDFDIRAVTEKVEVLKMASVDVPQKSEHVPAELGHIEAFPISEPSQDHLEETDPHVHVTDGTVLSWCGTPAERKPESMFPSLFMPLFGAPNQFGLPNTTGMNTYIAPPPGLEPPRAPAPLPPVQNFNQDFRHQMEHPRVQYGAPAQNGFPYDFVNLDRNSYREQNTSNANINLPDGEQEFAWYDSLLKVHYTTSSYY